MANDENQLISMITSPEHGFVECIHSILHTKVEQNWVDGDVKIAGRG